MYTRIWHSLIRENEAGRSRSSQSDVTVYSAPFCVLYLRNAANTHMEVVSYAGANTDWLERYTHEPQPLEGSSSNTLIALKEKRVINVPDIMADPLIDQRNPTRAKRKQLIKQRLSVAHRPTGTSNQNFHCPVFKLYAFCSDNFTQTIVQPIVVDSAKVKSLTT